MGRERHEASDTGRMGFREPDEPPDERPLIARTPFWKDESEKLTYEHAVQVNPRKPGEGAMTYLQRLAEYVKGKLDSAVRAMPDARLPYKDE